VLQVTITRTGANQAYATNWSKAFGGKSRKSAAAAAAAVAKPSKKKSAPKKRAKAKSGRK
jgi:hypothetical protein